MTDDIVNHLANLANDQVLYSTHYDGCHVYHLECAALMVCDENERLRAEVDALLAEMGNDHIPDETGRMCRTCGPGGGPWPCVHRIALDELKEASRG